MQLSGSLIKRFLWLALSMLLLPSITHARVHEFTLDNGMKILVKPDRRFPVAVSQVWYKVGSSYEHNGITGISHMLEHMLFKGTPKVPSGEFSRLIAANGGRENAFTSSDYTAYFQRLEKSRLEISFELEADRMKNALIPADEFIKERDVVTEERRLRTEDNPQAQTYEQFRATAFMNSPYHHSVIGWMQDIVSYDVEDARRWYRKWYAPNNAVLVVAGDVDPQAIFQLAKKHFGALKAGSVARVKPQQEIVQTGERRITVRIPATIEYIIMGYKAPSLKTAENTSDAYALEVLAFILDGGSSSRLPRELVRGQELAMAVSVSYGLTSRLDTLFTLSAVPARGKHSPTIEAALRKQIKRVRNERVSPAELKRAKTQILTNRTYERDSIFYQAMQLGVLESTGIGWQADEVFEERIRAVTAKDIQEVARKYLVDDALTVATLDPQPIENTFKRKRP